MQYEIHTVVFKKYPTYASLEFDPEKSVEKIWTIDRARKWLLLNGFKLTNKSVFHETNKNIRFILNGGLFTGSDSGDRRSYTTMKITPSIYYIIEVAI